MSSIKVIENHDLALFPHRTRPPFSSTTAMVSLRICKTELTLTVLPSLPNNRKAFRRFSKRSERRKRSCKRLGSVSLR